MSAPTAELGGELAAALEAGPSHAYLLKGPRGSGKRAAARAFAAEILAAGAPDPDSARRRALADPSPHPDLVWLRPSGAWHLVEDVRSEVIRACSLRPAEGEARVFVIEAAESMREESQNALLKTLEEPAGFAHLILISSEPEGLAATISSRCQVVGFAPLAPAVIAERLSGEAQAAELEAVSRLCRGDLELARHLLSQPGRELRAAGEAAARAPLSAQPAAEPWRGLLESAEAAGREAGAEVERRFRELTGGGERKIPRDATDQIKRVERRARTAELDLALALVCSWYRDLAAFAEDAPELAMHRDRLQQLAADAEGLAPERPREALELVLDTRRRLRLNVSEELAFDALWHRLAATLGVS
ncbi:MAG: ATP-binding protein [Solirubrobacterales bacterium]